MAEQRSSFTPGPNVFHPRGSSLCLPAQNNTTSSPLTALSRELPAGGDGAAAATTDLVALVDAVDELRVGGRPGETDGRRVDRLGLHVTGGDGGNWDGRGEEEWKKGETTGGNEKRRSVRAGPCGQLDVCLRVC